MRGRTRATERAPRETRPWSGRSPPARPPRSVGLPRRSPGVESCRGLVRATRRPALSSALAFRWHHARCWDASHRAAPQGAPPSPSALQHLRTFACSPTSLRVGLCETKAEAAHVAGHHGPKEGHVHLPAREHSWAEDLSRFSPKAIAKVTIRELGLLRERRTFKRARGISRSSKQASNNSTPPPSMGHVPRTVTLDDSSARSPDLYRLYRDANRATARADS